MLNDIINGSNPNCNSSGFHATTGWDPVTGLGKLIFLGTNKCSCLEIDCSDRYLGKPPQWQRRAFDQSTGLVLLNTLEVRKSTC